MSLRHRIEAQLEKLALTPRAASLAAGLNTHYLQRVLSDPDKSITTENLFKLASVLATSPEWLLTGRGPEDMPPGAEELLDAYRDMTEGHRKTLLDFARWLMTTPPG